MRWILQWKDEINESVSEETVFKNLSEKWTKQFVRRPLFDKIEMNGGLLM